MAKFIFLISFALLLALGGFAQQNPKQPGEFVQFKIINTDKSVKTLKFKWKTLAGPGNVGSSNNIVQVNDLLQANGFDCPPKRQKVSENTWLCGNGKKVNTNNPKLIELFSEAWDENE